MLLSKIKRFHIRVVKSSMPRLISHIILLILQSRSVVKPQSTGKYRPFLYFNIKKFLTLKVSLLNSHIWSFKQRSISFCIIWSSTLDRFWWSLGTNSTTQMWLELSANWTSIFGLYSLCPFLLDHPYFQWHLRVKQNFFVLELEGHSPAQPQTESAERSP